LGKEKKMLKKKRKRKIEFSAYIVPVNDDGYPMRDEENGGGVVCSPTHTIRAPFKVKSFADRWREARVKYHAMRVREEMKKRNK
jgi:hypothetical protein